jgi:lipopolysaccharide export system protein LptA
MKPVLLRMISAASILFAVTGSAMALEADRKLPMDIEADQVLFEEDKGKAIYKGSVVARQGTTMIKGTEVHLVKDDEGLKTATVFGRRAYYTEKPNPKEQQIEAWANRLTYDVRKQQIILLDNAEVVQGKDRFRSQRIVYDLKTRTIRADNSGKGRVRMTIHPGTTGH